MRNLIRSAVAYIVALLLAYYSMLTYTFSIPWYTWISLGFGFIVTYCILDIIDRNLDKLEQSEEVSAEPMDGDGE